MCPSTLLVGKSWDPSPVCPTLDHALPRPSIWTWIQCPPITKSSGWDLDSAWLPTHAPPKDLHLGVRAADHTRFQISRHHPALDAAFPSVKWARPSALHCRHPLPALYTHKYKTLITHLWAFKALYISSHAFLYILISCLQSW